MATTNPFSGTSFGDMFSGFLSNWLGGNTGQPGTSPSGSGTGGMTPPKSGSAPAIPQTSGGFRLPLRVSGGGGTSPDRSGQGHIDTRGSLYGAQAGIPTRTLPNGQRMYVNAGTPRPANYVPFVPQPSFQLTPGGQAAMGNTAYGNMMPIVDFVPQDPAVTAREMAREANAGLTPANTAQQARVAATADARQRALDAARSARLNQNANPAEMQANAQPLPIPRGNAAPGIGPGIGSGPLGQGPIDQSQAQPLPIPQGGGMGPGPDAVQVTPTPQPRFIPGIGFTAPPGFQQPFTPPVNPRVMLPWWQRLRPGFGFGGGISLF